MKTFKVSRNPLGSSFSMFQESFQWDQVGEFVEESQSVCFESEDLQMDFQDDIPVLQNISIPTEKNSEKYNSYNIAKACSIQKTLSKIYYTLRTISLILSLKQNGDSSLSTLKSRVKEIVDSYQNAKLCDLSCNLLTDLLKETKANNKNDNANITLPQGTIYLGEEFLTELKSLLNFFYSSDYPKDIKTLFHKLQKWQDKVIKDVWEMWHKNQPLIFYYLGKFREKEKTNHAPDEYLKIQTDISWGILKAILRYYPCSRRTFTTYTINWTFHHYKKGLIERDGKESFNSIVVSLDSPIAPIEGNNNNGNGEATTLLEIIDSTEYSNNLTPEENYHFLEQKEQLQKVLDALPSISKKVLVYRLVYNVTLDEIASKLNRSKEWVRKMLEIAQKQFLFEWKKRGFGKPIFTD